MDEEGATGGSEQLVQLIDEHGRALLFDLQCIGVDLRDLWRPGTGVTPRFVLMLVGQLPESSAFAASCRGGSEFRGWSLTNTLLAAQVNQLHAANQQRAGKKRIKPIVQPPQKAKPKRVVRIADIVAARKHRETDN